MASILEVKGGRMPNPVSADMILNQLWDRSIPVNIERIIHLLSIDMIKVRDNSLKGSGYADLQNGRRIIAINASECNERQRFTMAHELGHHALMHSLPRDRDEVASYGIDYFEIEANNFAAEILMPREYITADIDRFSSNGQIDVPSLAKRYNVSYDAMYFRLKNLGHG